MAIARGQTDRFGNPIPPNQSYKVIINSDGSVLRQREIITLDSTLTATDNDATGSTDLSAAGVETGITQLTGDGTAGPGAGSQAFTLTDSSVTNSKLANSGTTSGRVVVPVLIDDHTLSAAATYTSPTWANGAYQEIIVKFNGSVSAFAYLSIRANNDSGLNYVDSGVNINSAVAADSSANGTLGFARCGVDVTGGLKFLNEIHFFPITDGLQRAGWATSMVAATGLIATAYKRDAGFGWTDTVTNVTFITILLSTAATMTGNIKVFGIPS